MLIVGIHTTTKALSEAIVILCNSPQRFQPLREEVAEVVQRKAWSRMAL